MKRRITRRGLILTGAAIAGGIANASSLKSLFEHNRAIAEVQPPSTGTLPEQVLGKTGIKVPILGLGGAGQTPLDKADKEAEAIALVEAALKLGIRYFDTASSYGASEDHLGKVLPPYRKQLFLATKTAVRDRDGAWRELERSLKRLKTDYLDLWQLHHVSYSETLEEILSAQGAIKAIEEAKSQGIIKFAGITGHHDPKVIAEGLHRYPFDTALVSINAADIHHPRPFAPTILPVAKQNNVGIIAMKIPARGRLFSNGVLDGMHQAMGYVLSLDGVHCCVIAAESAEQLEANVRVAQAFKPLSSKEMAEIEKRTAIAWQDCTFFRSWD